MLTRASCESPSSYIRTSYIPHLAVSQPQHRHSHSNTGNLRVELEGRGVPHTTSSRDTLKIYPVCGRGQLRKQRHAFLWWNSEELLSEGVNALGDSSVRGGSQLRRQGGVLERSVGQRIHHLMFRRNTERRRLGLKSVVFLHKCM